MGNWQDSLRQSLRTREQLEAFFQCPFPPVSYPLSLPLRMAQKIKEQGLNGPLGLQFLPHQDEELKSGLTDPIGDSLRYQGGGIIHRYPNRILVSPTPFCPVQCRYCFRKNSLQEHPEHYRNNLKNLESYLHKHPEIHEVILTGGDPLVATDQVLGDYLNLLARMPQVKFLRLHSRTPVMLPERLTPELIQLMASFHSQHASVHLVVHTNHWSELDSDVMAKLKCWQRAGLAVMTQSVLLCGVNDNAQDLYQLCFHLALHDIRPYYLHHPDRVRGAMHFYLPLEQGRALYKTLRSQLPGWALPHYVIDHPQGTGKTLALIDNEADSR